MNAVVSILLAFFGLTSAFSGFAQVSFPVSRPDIKVGDRWKTASLDGFSKLQDSWLEQTVSGSDGDTFTVSSKSSAGQEELQRFDRDLNAYQEVKGKQELQVRVKFPLEVGKTWDTKYEWINPRGHHGRMEMSFKVGDPERVVVPAGTFDAIPIEGRGFWYNLTTGASGPAIEKRWYAPAARNMVRRTWVTRYVNGGLDQNRVFELQEVRLTP